MNENRYVCIELGSTRIKAVLINADHHIVASGNFTWESLSLRHIVTFAHWANIASTVFDYTPDEALNFTNNLNDKKTADSAAALYYDPVSYTHLDVYKRQALYTITGIFQCRCFFCKELKTSVKYRGDIVKSKEI